MRTFYALLLSLGLATSAFAVGERYGPDPRDSAEYPVIDTDVTF